MTPVTGRITDGEQDNFAFGLGGLEGLGSPGVPVDRIMRVLEKIRARLGDESVDELWSAVRVEVVRTGFVVRSFCLVVLHKLGVQLFW